jgi:beta-glucanase (GH16 family)
MNPSTGRGEPSPQRSVMIRAMVTSVALLALVVRPLPAAPPSPDYELLFADEFDGDALDTAVWTCRTGPRMDGLNRPENVSVSGGALRIAVRIDTIKGKPTPTGGGVISRAPFGYGYYESRSKPFMAGTGVHSSFWQAGGGPNNRIFEIDSYEIDSGSSLACNNLYVHVCSKDFPEVPWPLRAHVTWKPAADGWFVDGYEYTPDGVIFFDNGRQVARVEWPDLTAQQVVWLTGLNGCGKVDPAKQPGETLFDYVRYYARDYPGITLLPNGSFEYNQDKVDAAKPVAWTVGGTASAARVIRGAAAHDRFLLRIGGTTTPFETTVTQSLAHIRNGDYLLTAKVRASAGLEKAHVRVTGTGVEPQSVTIPVADEWTAITLPRVAVASHAVTVAIEAAGPANAWLEIDDVRFMKPPAAGREPRTPRAFARGADDPVWHALQHPLTFPGDRTFCFFGRTVGLGPEITASFVMKPARRADVSPIARMPKKGTDGWMVMLTAGGDVVFRVGSAESHTDVDAKAGYEPGREMLVTCVFDRGTARVYVDGRLAATRSGISQGTSDTTEPGRLGTVNDAYLAVGDVIVANDKPAAPPTSGKKLDRFSGVLRDVRVYNRALTAEEVRALGKSPAR